MMASLHSWIMNLTRLVAQPFEDTDSRPLLQLEENPDIITPLLPALEAILLAAILVRNILVPTKRLASNL